MELNMSNDKIAIMGGTFDPIHIGHLIAAERVHEELGVDYIYFIPSNIPPHKNYENMADSSQRYNMVELAIKSNPRFKISDIELKRQGNSYTIDTIRELKKTLITDTTIYFIIGADNASAILRWKEAEELLKIVELVIVTRPGKWENGFESEINLLKNSGGTVHVIEIPLISVSSGEIRNRVRNNKRIEYLVPEEVKEYIYENKLYTT